MQTVPVAMSQPNPLQAAQPFIWTTPRSGIICLRRCISRLTACCRCSSPFCLASLPSLLLVGLHADRHGCFPRCCDGLSLRPSSTSGLRTIVLTRAGLLPLRLQRWCGARLFWGCLLLGLLIGVSAFDTSFATAATMPISLLPYLTHAVGAIFLLIAGNLIARFLARSVLIGAVNAQLQYARFLSLGVKWLVLVLTAAMVLEHLEIGGVVVDLAFGILFGGIVLTLSLAVGLGSRELVSRSLESRTERPGEQAAAPPAANADEPIRHF